MGRRTKIMTEEPYHHNPHIVVGYELPFAKDLITPGDFIRIKGRRGKFRFIKVVQNMETDVTWVDVTGDDGGFHSFYVEKIKTVIREKKSRRKKQLVV